MAISIAMLFTRGFHSPAICLQRLLDHREISHGFSRSKSWGHLSSPWTKPSSFYTSWRVVSTALSGDFPAKFHRKVPRVKQMTTSFGAGWLSGPGYTWLTWIVWVRMQLTADFKGPTGWRQWAMACRVWSIKLWGDICGYGYSCLNDGYLMVIWWFRFIGDYQNPRAGKSVLNQPA